MLRLVLVSVNWIPTTHGFAPCCIVFAHTHDRSICTVAPSVALMLPCRLVVTMLVPTLRECYLIIPRPILHSTSSEKLRLTHIPGTSNCLRTAYNHRHVRFES